MSKISRDPEDYELTTHAGQQYKHREIGIDVVGEAIREGEIKQADAPHQKAFVYEIPYCVHPVAVVVDPQDGEIVTVEWCK